MKPIYFILILLAAASCKEKYNIQPKSSDLSVLVVEGMLNATAGQPTTIKLTKSTKVNSGTILPVSQAVVTVEENGGSSVALPESGNTGNYIATLSLNTTKEYRVRIKTNDGKEYVSDYVPVKQSPDIDSVNWKWENNGVMIYANTHDATNSSKYYKWEFDETWEITSPYASFYKVQGNQIVDRTFIDDDVSHCWKYDRSKSIIINSTAQLQSDVVFEYPVYYIPKNVEKIGVRYSILLKQQVLTKQAYEFFDLMKQSTEQLGSIFDRLPSELKGNIKCISDPDQPAIGYITASTQKEKRIFIKSQELPLSQYTFPGCANWIRVPNRWDSLQKYIPSQLPWQSDMLPNGTIIGYFLAPALCVDCTLRAGTNVKPSYW